MGAIDMHVHAFPDDVAPRAIAKLEELAPWTAAGEGTIDDLLRSMDQADIDVSVVCTIATKPDQAEGIGKWCEKIRSDRIEPFPSVHPKTPGAVKWIKRFAEAGFMGIKLHPMYQDFPADERRMDEIYAAAAQAGLILAMHSGCDIAFEPQDDRASPRRMRNVIDRFEGLKLICTHLGGWRSWDEVEKHLIGREVCIETSFSLQVLGPQRAAELIRKHGPNRVLFGTDWPWTKQAEEIQHVRRLDLPEPDKNAILWTNAAKLLGL